MGCGEECPFVPGVKVVDWQIPDPKDRPLERVREIRDEIMENVKVLLQSMEFESYNGSAQKII
jgi:arsenate reductase